MSILKLYYYEFSDKLLLLFFYAIMKQIGNIYGGYIMDGIIFDVDGTLWDSTEVVARSWNQAIRENSNLPADLTAAKIKSLFGKTMHEITLALFPDSSSEEQMRLGDLCFEYENKLLETEPGILYPGVREAFETLSQKYDLYIVSNCQCGYIELFLKGTNLSSYVKDTLCFGQTGRPKNETIRLLMERNHLEDVCYVGDTMGDYESCIKADVPFVFAEYGFGDVPKAKTRIQNLMDLHRILP